MEIDMNKRLSANEQISNWICDIEKRIKEEYGIKKYISFYGQFEDSNFNRIVFILTSELKNEIKRSGYYDCYCYNITAPELSELTQCEIVKGKDGSYKIQI